MAAATKWKSFIAEFVKSQFSRSKQTPKTLPQKRFADIRDLHGAGRRSVCPIHDFALDAGCAGVANGCTGPIATGLALVAIVVGGLMEIAEEHGLKVIDGRVVIPDLRLEYETPDHEQSRVDLEVVTGNYRSGGLSAKARAGFRMYASAADQVRLRAAMTDPEIMQEIFSL